MVRFLTLMAYEVNDHVRQELGRLQAICRRLSELRIPAIKDEVEQLQVIVWAMQRKLQYASTHDTPYRRVV